jgi:hypothetical protein
LTLMIMSATKQLNLIVPNVTVTHK